MNNNKSSFKDLQAMGRRGELMMFLRLCNRAYNPPCPGDSRHFIVDVSNIREYQQRGVDIVESWKDRWGVYHELWHEIKTDYNASANAKYTPGKTWADIASYFYGEPWKSGSGNLFIETSQRCSPGWYNTIRRVDPRAYGADGRIIWFTLPPAEPETAEAYEIPSIAIAVEHHSLIDTVEEWKAREHISPCLTRSGSKGYLLPIPELWNWTEDTKRQAFEMNPVKLSGIVSSTGSGARCFLLMEHTMLMLDKLEEAEQLKDRVAALLQAG